MGKVKVSQLFKVIICAVTLYTLGFDKIITLPGSSFVYEILIAAIGVLLALYVKNKTRSNMNLRIDQMFYRSMSLIVGMTASFQNVIEANQVCFYISVWIRDRVTNARLCAEIDNDLRLILLKNSCDCFLIC